MSDTLERALGQALDVNVRLAKLEGAVQSHKEQCEERWGKQDDADTDFRRQLSRHGDDLARQRDVLSAGLERAHEMREAGDEKLHSRMNAIIWKALGISMAVGGAALMVALKWN